MESRQGGRPFICLMDANTCCTALRQAWFMSLFVRVIVGAFGIAEKNQAFFYNNSLEAQKFFLVIVISCSSGRKS